jgi:alginate O-acetyltransferase complex protein AlgI
MPQINRVIAEGFLQKKFVVFGMTLLVIGLVKKVVFADSLGPIVDDIFFVGPDSFGQAWLGALLFAFQIYFDFSGYSDIAVGAAFLLGIKIPFNFRSPYLSKGPAEFWTRWHITLSTWIRDYLYIPLGGSRGNKWRIVTVLMVTMALAGLWHGVNYTFVIWGAAWGVYILIGRVLLPLQVRFAPIRWLLHMGVVTVLWVFFRAPNIDDALEYIGVMFDFGSGVGEPSSAALIGLGLFGLFGIHWLESRLSTRSVLWKLRRLNKPFVIATSVGIILGLLLIPAETQNPFIYFRF